MEFIPFDGFLKQVKEAKFEQYSEGAVKDEGAFERMRSHILTMYDGVGQVTGSFVLEAEHVDCIDIEKQPSVRIPRLDIKSPPPSTQPPTPLSDVEGGRYNNIDSPLKRGLKDAFGNAISCPNSTIPFSRITLEKLTRFATLSDFFSKLPKGARNERNPNDIQRTVEPHLYAFSYQSVNNWGGNSWLNVWAPIGDFSLSQQWYDAGSDNGLQTVEGGWVVYPNKFSTNPVLFIFFTPDNYASGCYNLECPGFVQTSPDWFLGSPLTPSVMEGAQNGIQMTWELNKDGWWLYMAGTDTREAVGYYPISVYNGGPLATNAVAVKFGGEVYRNTPANLWPQMGSSVPSNRGYGHSAFQHSVYYISQGGGSVWTSLTGSVIGSPTCWSVDVATAVDGGDWGAYFYYGGPGGKVCT